MGLFVVCVCVCVMRRAYGCGMSREEAGRFEQLEKIKMNT